jgi:hypothetical protein
MQTPADDELAVQQQQQEEEEEEPEPTVDQGGDDEDSIPEEFESAIDQRDEDGESEPPQDDIGRTQYYTAPTSQRNSPLLSKEDFWDCFNHVNQKRYLKPVPWVQIGPHVVDFWGLWQNATAEPQFSRDWEVVAENLGLDWIAEPHIPIELKVAFENHLQDIENQVLGFLRVHGEQGETEEGEEGEEGAEGDEGAEVDEVEEVISEEVEEGLGAVEDEEMREQTASLASDPNFESSPPVIGTKRARRSSTTLHFSSVRKRPRYDLSSEIPETPETQETAAALAAAAGQETPSRRPRVLPQIQQQLESAGRAQFDRSAGGDDDDDRLSPSLQLQSEMDGFSPAQGPSQSLPRIPSSPNRPLPSVERDDDETSESSDAFESLSNIPIRNQPNSRPGRELDGITHRRTLPWASDGRKQGMHSNLSEAPRRRTLPWSGGEDKGKQPASSTPRPPPRTLTTATTTTPAQPSSTPHSLTPAIRITQAPPPAPSSSKPPTSTPKNRPLDPAPILNHFISQGYAAHLVARAVKASTCRQSEAQIVLDSLKTGRGIPGDVPGVWTEEDDRLLREIGAAVDRLKGVLPHRADRGPFGEGDGRRVFWRLVAKHGAEGVFERREFLRNWDRA